MRFLEMRLYFVLHKHKNTSLVEIKWYIQTDLPKRHKGLHTTSDRGSISCRQLKRTNNRN